MKPKAIPSSKETKDKNKKKVEIRLKINLWRILLGLLVLVLVIPFILSFFQTQIDESQIELSQALSDIKADKVEKVTLQDNKIILDYNGEGEENIKFTTKEPSISFPELLDRSGIDASKVNYTISDQGLIKAFGELLGVLLPLALMGGLFFFFFRSQTRGAQDIFSFGRSKAKLFSKGKQDVTFNDVAGVDEAKKELEEIVDFLKHPAKYRAIGARTPKGVLLFGPSGVGKTLLAKAVAGEAGVPFFSMAGSEFMEMLVGVGASRVRDLFSTAKTSAPSIIFIDEVDAIGRHRGRSGFVGGHDEREQTLNQILVEMDGFTPNDNVIVIAATNRGDLLDPALLRPGRFDRRITLDMPDKEGRADILKIHAQNKKFTKNINWEKISDRTVGFSGADLENMTNEAAIHAAREGKKEIAMEDLEEAATKVKLGPAKKRLQSAEDKKITAYHEAGHAIVSHALPKMDPVQRISIIARSRSLGHTEISLVDRSHETKSRLLDQIATMLGGRAAEELIFNDITAGAASDIQGATRIARAMVEDFGMSDLGPINLGPQVGYDDFGNANWMEPSQVSSHTKEQIDLEITKILGEAHKKAIIIVKKEKKNLDKVAVALLKTETLNRDEFEKIVGKK